MTSIEDVYRKFGETAEAAQLLETQLGNLLLIFQLDESLKQDANVKLLVASIVERINRSTLGQLISKFNFEGDIVNVIEKLFYEANKQRNRLMHSFFREHNFRKNTDDGCNFMLTDLQKFTRRY